MLAFGPAPQPGQGGGALVSLVPLLLLCVVFYFVLIQPQQKRAKEHARMLKTVKAGDKIVTNGGIVAVVVTVKEKTLNVRSGDAKFEMLKSAITEITERAGEGNEP